MQVKAGKSTKPLRGISRPARAASVRGGKAGLKIYVDGRSAGVTTPGVVRGLKPGRHTIELREQRRDRGRLAERGDLDSPQNQPVQF